MTDQDNRPANAGQVSIDIFIPFWSAADLLAAAVASVLSQTDPRWRLTVVDDASVECVDALFAEITDPRVRYIRNPENLGITGNFQRCVDLATADYVCIMGADDMMLPNYVELVLTAADRFPSVDVIETGVQVVDAMGLPTEPLTDRVKRFLTPHVPVTGACLGDEALAISLLRGNWLYWPSLTFRLSAAKRVPFRHEFRYIQDLAFIIDLIAKGSSLAFVPLPALMYRRHPLSASEMARGDGSRFEGELRFFRGAAQMMRARGWRRAARVADLRVIARLHALISLRETVAYGGWQSAMRLAFSR